MKRGRRTDQKKCPCGRRAVFNSKKDRRFRRDKDHTLCIRCYEKQMEQYRVKPEKEQIAA